MYEILSTYCPRHCIVAFKLVFPCQGSSHSSSSASASSPSVLSRWWLSVRRGCDGHRGLLPLLLPSIAAQAALLSRAGPFCLDRCASHARLYL